MMKKITCFGTGVIGCGWATNFLMAGLQPILYDIDKSKLDEAKKEIEHNLRFLLESKVLTPEQYEAGLEAIIYTTNPQTALQEADLIQENGPENLSVKQSIVETIEAFAPPGAIIASSTSGLLISDIAAKAKHPERFVGAHPYNPVHLIPLVELTRGEQTDQQHLDNALSFYKSIKKEPIVLRKEALGFISNRIQMALYREAVDLVCRGVCSMDEIDRAVCYGPGLRYALMGPNTIYQLGGGAHGISGLLHHVGATIPLWWKDMARWTDWPDGWLESVQGRMNEALALREETHGRTNEEITQFRDEGLILLLKYHGKI